MSRISINRKTNIAKEGSTKWSVPYRADELSAIDSLVWEMTRGTLPGMIPDWTELVMRPLAKAIPSRCRDSYFFIARTRVSLGSKGEEGSSRREVLRDERRAHLNLKGCLGDLQRFRFAVRINWHCCFALTRSTKPFPLILRRLMKVGSRICPCTRWSGNNRQPRTTVSTIITALPWALDLLLYCSLVLCSFLVIAKIVQGLHCKLSLLANQLKEKKNKIESN